MSFNSSANNTLRLNGSIHKVSSQIEEIRVAWQSPRAHPLTTREKTAIGISDPNVIFENTPLPMSPAVAIKNFGN